MAKNVRLIDLTGLHYGKWLVLFQNGNSRRGAALWHCRCECGNEADVIGTDLRLGKSTRCAPCGRQEAFWPASKTHGQSKTRLYRIWKAMRARCANHNLSGYENYGGRGIKVVEPWASSFKPFSEWAASSGYSPELSIERIDVNGDYSPSNCTWATAATQSVNRRFVKTDPSGKPWSHVARDNGITMGAYRTRLFDGWSHQEAATRPVRPIKAAG